MRRNASTELSSRLSRLTVISAWRLFSRSACLSVPPPPLTSVSYIVLILGQPARKDVAHRGVDGELESGQLIEDLVEADYVRPMGERAMERNAA